MKNKFSFFKKFSALTLAAALAFAAGCSNESAGGTESQGETKEQFSKSQIAETSESPSVSDNAQSNEVESTTAQEETTAFALPEEIPEIVELFNQSANRIKTEASKVVKNYEKRNSNEEELVVPAALESIAKSAFKTFLSDDTEPIVYDTKEEIVAEYIVPGQSYVSKLTPDTVKSATCTDNGETYTIHIKLKDEKNPTAGKGIGAVCDVIEAEEVAEKTSIVESFSTEYYDCEVRVTVDKESGRVISANYIVPLILKIKVNMFGTHDFALALSFEKDYTIYY